MKKRMYRFLMTGVMAAAMLGMTACGSKTGTGDTAAAAAATQVTMHKKARSLLGRAFLCRDSSSFAH